MTDLDFYYYRKREGSVMQSLNHTTSLYSFFQVIHRLVLFIADYENKKKDTILKSWMYVNIYRMIWIVYKRLLMINNSTSVIPNEQLIDIYTQLEKFMCSDAKQRCENYYLMAKESEKRYLEWKNNPWDKYLSRLSEQALKDKEIILIYNYPEWYSLEFLTINKLPSNYLLTFDHKYINQASVFVFYIDNLVNCLSDDLDKFENQTWIAWGREDEENYPMMKDKDFRALFDIWMNFCETSEVMSIYSIDKYKQGIKKYNIQKSDPFICLCNMLRLYFRT